MTSACRMGLVGVRLKKSGGVGPAPSRHPKPTASRAVATVNPGARRSPYRTDRALEQVDQPRDVGEREGAQARSLERGIAGTLDPGRDGAMLERSVKGKIDSSETRGGMP